MKVASLLLSHLLVLGLCFLLGKSGKGPVADTGGNGADEFSHQNTTSNPSRGMEVIASFIAPPLDSYKELARTLESPEDYAKTLDSLIGKLGAIKDIDNEAVDLTNEQIEVLNQFHAYLDQWLRSDKAACFAFLTENREANRAAMLKNPNVLVEFLAEGGVLGNLDFFRANEKSFGTIWSQLRLLPRVLAKEAEKGFSLRQLDDIDSQLKIHPAASYSILRALAPHISFDERDAFLDRVLADVNSGPTLINFLGNPDHPRKELLAWYRDLLASDRLDAETRQEMSGNLRWWLQGEGVTMEASDRLALAEEHLGESHGRAVVTVMAGEVKQFLNSGRDYRYDFRHGAISAAEVLADYHANSPGLFEIGSQEAIIGLYRELAEENPTGAIAILDELHDPALAEQTRAEAPAFFFGNVEPDLLLAHNSSLPPSAPLERAWQERADDLLRRHGQDFVAWVAALPAGAQRDAAAHWTAEYAREILPDQAETIAGKLNVAP